MKIYIVLLGGPEENMKQRIKTAKILLQKNHDTVIVYCGFASQINFFKHHLNSHHYLICESFDTVSNFWWLSYIDQHNAQLHIPTGPLHYRRIISILKRVYHSSIEIKHYPTNEKEYIEREYIMSRRYSSFLGIMFFHILAWFKRLRHT